MYILPNNKKINKFIGLEYDAITNSNCGIKIKKINTDLINGKSIDYNLIIPKEIDNKLYPSTLDLIEIMSYK